MKWFSTLQNSEEKLAIVPCNCCQLQIQPAKTVKMDGTYKNYCITDERINQQMIRKISNMIESFQLFDFHQKHTVKSVDIIERQLSLVLISTNSSMKMVNCYFKHN